MCFYHVRGFTLIELLIVIAIIFITALTSFSHFQTTFANQERKRVMSTLQYLLKQARSAALIHHSNTVVCPSLNAKSCNSDNSAPWNSILIVFLDKNGNRQIDSGERILLLESLNLKYGQLDWRGTLHMPSISFRASDGLAAGSNGSFYYCANSLKDHQRLVLSAVSQMRVEEIVSC